jgi:hypothetical protein
VSSNSGTRLGGLVGWPARRGGRQRRRVASTEPSVPATAADVARTEPSVFRRDGRRRAAQLGFYIRLGRRTRPIAPGLHSSSTTICLRRRSTSPRKASRSSSTAVPAATREISSRGIRLHDADVHRPESCPHSRTRGRPSTCGGAAEAALTERSGLSPRRGESLSEWAPGEGWARRRRGLSPRAVRIRVCPLETSACRTQGGGGGRSGSAAKADHAPRLSSATEKCASFSN